jgi:proteasome component ECM29
MESKDALLQEAAFLAIDQLSIFSVLSPGSLPVAHTTESIIEKLAKSAKTGKEKAGIALGRFAMIFEDDKPETAQFRFTILDHIYKLHELRQPEIHFSVGEALSCVAAGWGSKILLVELDVEGEIPETTAPPHALSEILDRILKDSSGSKPALRKVRKTKYYYLGRR